MDIGDKRLHFLFVRDCLESREAEDVAPDTESGTGKMKKFGEDYDNVMFSGKFSDVSEPLKEHTVNDNGFLTETPTSRTLLGVKSMSTERWGWIDTCGINIIPAEYDSWWILCHNGIIVLEKNGKYGGLYRNNLRIAFNFAYDYVGHCYQDVFCVHKNNRVALMKPGEKRLTGFDCLGITTEHYGPIFGYVKEGFFGRKNGTINVLTGIEQ